MSTAKLSRRELLGSAAAAGVFTIVPRHVLGGPGRTPPSDTVLAAHVGCGGRKWGGLGCVGSHKLIAFCDVDLHRVGGAVDNEKYYSDFRRLMDRKDIDVISIATPPHWHALVCIAAAQAGKDIFCEKPMTRFIAEGRAVVEAVKRYGRVFQIGTFGRFGASRTPHAVTTHKIMGSGLLPREKAPRIVVRQNWKIREWSGRINVPPEPVPENLLYDFWLGPAPFKPYFRHRTHGSFRGYWDYDGGGLADMGQHYLDAHQWTLNKDHTSPVRIRAHAPWPAHPDACGLWGWVEMEYADGTAVIFETNEWGTGYPGDSRRYPEPADLDEPARRTLAATPDPEPLRTLAEAVRTRKPAGGNAEASHRCATLLHLANIAIRLGRELRFDPGRERFLGDDEANRLANVPMRAPWHL